MQQFQQHFLCMRQIAKEETNKDTIQFQMEQYERL